MSEQQSSEEQKKREKKLRAWKKQNRKFYAEFGDKHGDFVKRLIKRGIVRLFQELGYVDGNVISICRGGMTFRDNKLGIRNSFGMVIDDGKIAIFIYVAIELETWCVRSHIEALENYRRYIDAKGSDKRCFIGAVAGGVVKDEAAEFAQQNGLYVIVQSGEAVDIVTPPEGFVAKEW